jgi:SAM-dependent methyltransferase
MNQESANPNIPIPPIHLRRSVGLEDVAYFDNPTRGLVFGDAVEATQYRSVFDFGCGCGRIARQLLLQRDKVPEEYVGIDLFKASIEWCTENLTRVNRRFTFYHHDFYNPGLNPGGSRKNVGLPKLGQFALVNAHSVFTHIIEDYVRFYFEEVSSFVADQGCIRVSWFLFNKAYFPMMQTFQNSLYINTDDPSNAVIYDMEFVRELYKSSGLGIYKVEPPAVRGHQWLIYAKKGASVCNLEFPEDVAPIGLARPPITRGEAE